MENLQVPVLISKEWEIPRGHDYHDWIARSEGTMTYDTETIGFSSKDWAVLQMTFLFGCSEW
jgi:hypothetical protein